MLRKAGDFKNKSVVEFATIKVEIPNGMLPKNLQNPDVDKNDLVRGLSVSGTGRLTYKQLYLDSEELAYAYREYIHNLFESRKYANDYRIEVVVKTTTETKTATKLKERHSRIVRKTLSA